MAEARFFGDSVWPSDRATATSSRISMPSPRVPGGVLETGFERLWLAFMSARVLLGLSIFALHLSASWMGQPVRIWAFGLSLAYACIAVAQRLWGRTRGPEQSFDRQWLSVIGFDLLYVGLLHFQPFGGAQVMGVHYTPLLALPVLMASILGSRPVALGTAALAALMLLGVAALGARHSLWDSASDFVQSGLLGAGLMALAWVTNHLAVRLAKEQLTALRSRLQAQLQSRVNNLVIESMNDGVLVVDADYVVHTANPAARALMGSDEEVTPTVFRLTDDSAWIQLLHVARLSFEDGPIDATEVILHHEDRLASQLKVRTECTPQLSREDHGLCVMFLQDMRASEARLRTEKLAAMGRMSAAVAHEFRNPLAAITQANALLQEELQVPVHQRLSGMIEQNAARLLHIVNDVMDVVRVQGPPDAAQEALLLDEEVALFCHEWATQNAVDGRLRLILRAEGVHVRFAREHLRRLLVNLLDNAARYASGGEAAIQVETQFVRHGPAVLRVWSDGAPIEPTVQRHLFEPFFSSESRSSGLGLFICQELCERHGASIGHERTARQQDGVPLEGNEFFIHFRRAPSGHTIWGFEESTLP